MEFALKLLSSLVRTELRIEKSYCDYVIYRATENKLASFTLKYCEAGWFTDTRVNIFTCVNCYYKSGLF